jgi:hypothetical protein
MSSNFSTQLSFGLFAIAVLSASGVGAQDIVEQSAEYRYQLDFHVPDAALAKFLPQGWEPNISQAGNAKDANLRLIFIDRLAVLDAEGNAIGAGSTQMVYLAIPVQEVAGDAAGQMIIAGLTADSAAVPGPFGVYQHAVTANMDRSIETIDGKVIVEEDWDFATATGERLQMHIKYERAATRSGGRDTMFFDPNDPTKHLIFRPRQGIDIGRNVTTNPPDRVQEFSYTAGGGRIAELFDGTERVLSWDSFPWYNLEILSPQ